MRANKGTTSEATDAFLRVHKEIKLFRSLSPQADCPSPHRKKLPDPITALESASKRDEKSTGTLSKVKSVFNLKAPVSDLS